MTREEAIYVLRREIEQIEGEWHPFEEVEEALNMAIEALSAEASQSLAEPNNDLRGSDIISRDVVLANIDERLRANGYGNVGLVSEFNRLIGYVRNIPSADAVEVVRCKDCKHWASAEDYDCEIHSGAFGADDFCSYGERKGGDE